MILDKIITEKRKEVLVAKNKLPLSKLRLKKSTADFKRALSGKKLSLIAEIKKASPTAGIVRKEFSPTAIAKEYNTNKNVAAISVITDKKFFSGDINFIKQIKKITKKPILRKDFIIDPYQVYEARHYKADAILLIAKTLSQEEINQFIQIAKKYSMDCMVEVSNSEELEKVLATKASIIAINNRDLEFFKIDINKTLRLIKKIPKNKIIVSESGYNTKKQIENVKGKVNAVLIGTSIMRSDDITKKINQLME